MNYTNPSVAISATLSDGERAKLETRLWELLSHRVKLYTFTDSTSIRTETAEEIFRSVAFTLEVLTHRNSMPNSALLEGDINLLFSEALRSVRELICKGKKLYATACLTSPNISNSCYAATLESIGDFFKKYDCEFFAHQIPCSIDYQLASPVSENLKGIEYINTWLRTVITENALLRGFDAGECHRLLTAVCPGYESLPINMYEPVLVNAVGSVLADGKAGSLEISEQSRQMILVKFTAITRAERKSALLRAAETVLGRIGVRDTRSKIYAAGVLRTVTPRLENGILNEKLENIFV